MQKSGSSGIRSHTTNKQAGVNKIQHARDALATGDAPLFRQLSTFLFVYNAVCFFVNEASFVGRYLSIDGGNTSAQKFIKAADPAIINYCDSAFRPIHKSTPTRIKLHPSLSIPASEFHTDRSDYGLVVSFSSISVAPPQTVCGRLFQLTSPLHSQLGYSVLLSRKATRDPLVYFSRTVDQPASVGKRARNKAIRCEYSTGPQL